MGKSTPAPIDMSMFERRVPPKRVYCWFGKLKPAQQEAVDAARGAGHTQKTIAAVVSEDFGVKIVDTAISNHYTGKCTCDR